MQNCQNIKVDLSAFVDGELSPARRAEIQSHLAACPDCGRELAALRQLTAGVRALPPANPSPQFLADVRRQIRQSESSSLAWTDKIFRPFWLKLPMEALAVALVVAGIFVLVRPVASGCRSVQLAMQRDKQLTTPEAAPAPVTPVPTTSAAPPPPRQARILTEETKTEPKDAIEAIPAQRDFEKNVTITNSIVVSDGAGAIDGAMKLDRVQPAPAVGGIPPAPRETVIVSGDSLVAVKLRAEKLAEGLQGHFDSVTRSNTLLVYLPKSKVGAFRKQITAAASTDHSMMAAGRAYGGAVEVAPSTATATLAPQTKASSLDSVTEPVIGLEIVVETNAVPQRK